MEKVYVIHENAEWVEPLRSAFNERDIPFEEWDLSSGSFDLSKAPPQGVFYNRMSASSYTRDHRFAPEYAAAVLGWLEGHGRRIMNASRALALEVNKAAQYAALQAHGVQVPKTMVAYGKQEILNAAKQFGTGPLILKPNRGGKGDQVQLFESVDELVAYVSSGDYRAPVDEISLLQDYIYAPDRSITRAEFIGGRFYYAVRVDTSDGFELCPADVCSIAPDGPEQMPKFSIFEEGTGIPPKLKDKLETVLAQNAVEVAGIEFIRNAEGEVFVYDINTNTNYNSDAESLAGLSGMGRLAEHLGTELERLFGRVSQNKPLKMAS